MTALTLTREQILAFRRAAGHLDRRLPMTAGTLQQATWAGLQDSMPRAALLSIHARVADTRPESWEDGTLTQVWGPRFSAYVVAEGDAPLFTLARLPDAGATRKVAVEMADALDAFLAGRRMSYANAGHAMGIPPNRLRYGTLTGRLRIRWEGARPSIVWTVPPPDVDPFAARVELARRFLHVFGPSTASAFSDWAGIKPGRAEAAFAALQGSLVPVETPIGGAWLLASDEEAARTAAGGRPPSPTVRLLPSGDTFYLLHGRERQLVVPDPVRRAALWTSRVWPGCLLVDGEPAGTWRRADATVAVEPWRRLTAPETDAVEAEAASLPLPGVAGAITVRWVR